MDGQTSAGSFLSLMHTTSIPDFCVLFCYLPLSFDLTSSLIWFATVEFKKRTGMIKIYSATRTEKVLSSREKKNIVNENWQALFACSTAVRCRNLYNEQVT